MLSGRNRKTSTSCFPVHKLENVELKAEGQEEGDINRTHCVHVCQCHTKSN